MGHIPASNRYDQFPYRRCGQSGLKLPPIALGLWHNFGGVDPPELARRMILRAFDRGINHFDLANNYGPPPGSAEETFGAILRDDLGSYRDELVVSTKAGYLMWPGPYGEWGSRKYMLASLDQSLSRTGLDYVDIFYSHRPDPETPLEETMGALDQAVRSGKALYAGISSYNPHQTRDAVRILRALGTPCLIHQPVYNMFRRGIESELLGILETEGIGCVAFSPLAQGLLTARYLEGIPPGSRAAKPHGFLSKDQITSEVITKVRSLNDVARSRGQSLAQMGIAWVLRHQAVTSAIVGASSVAQLDEVLGALHNLKLSQGELQAIDDILTP
jgi:L-glyceraldehyde 3-phosphate reductase